jgi:hypothetical protein
LGADGVDDSTKWECTCPGLREWVLMIMFLLVIIFILVTVYVLRRDHDDWEE